MKWIDKWLSEKKGENKAPSSSPCRVQHLRVVNACDILAAIPTENVAHEYLEVVVDTYLDWSQTGSLQKLSGVDVILVKADVIMDRISFRVATERGKEKRGTGVPDTLAPFFHDVDYINIYTPPRSE